jgi:hypothetical protein
MTCTHRGLVGLLVATMACTVWAAEPAAPKPAGWTRSLVVKDQGYFPVALRLQDGRIAAVLRGGAGHLGIKGRLDMVFSSDDGRSWTPPVLVVDTPIDDRNPGLGQARDGTLVVGFCRTANYDDKDRYDPKLGKLEDTRFTLSRDGGKTWSESAEIGVSEFGWGSPFGKIVTLPDGAMLMPIYGGQRRPPGSKPAGEEDHSYLYRSADNGRTWTYFTEIGDGKQQFNETALLRLASGKFLAAMRSRGGDTWLTESDDGARTWSKPRLLTPPSIHPADLVELDDGRVLLVMGNRASPKGVVGMVGDRQQHFDWSQRFTLVDDAYSADCGYPSSVKLPGGRALTLYYATQAKEHPEWRVHCGAVSYDLPPAR